VAHRYSFVMKVVHTYIHTYIQKMSGSLKIAKIMSIYQIVRQNDTARNM